MAGTSAPLRAGAPEPEALPSIRDGIIARWSGASLSLRGSPIDAAVDVCGNEIILTGTTLTADDRNQAATLATAESLGMLIVNRIRLPGNRS